MRKLLSITLVIVIAFSVSAPRAAATGVEGAALTVAEMAGVVSLVAGSLGIVFSGAGDMHDACEAFVRGLDPNSAAYLALASAVAQGSTIYIAGANAVNYLGGLVDSVRSFFNVGSSVFVPGTGGIANLGQIYQGEGVPEDFSGLSTFTVMDEPVVFEDMSGNLVASISAYPDKYSSSATRDYYKLLMTVVLPSRSFTSNSSGVGVDPANPAPFIYFSVNSNGVIYVNMMVYGAYDGGTGWHQSRALSTTVKFSAVASVSGGGDVDINIPVFQEAGALAPDLVGGVWDRLAEDAAAQNGNVTIDTNVGTYVGGATGYVDGDPNGAIAAPQAPSLGGVGSTRTETDTSTGTTTQTRTETGLQAVPQSQTANPAITDVQAETSFNGATLALADIFPFCIPFDVYWMLKGFAVGREAPHFDIDLVLPGWLDYTYTFDFSPFESYAQVVRAGELAVFVIGLAAATRKFIKW